MLKIRNIQASPKKSKMKTRVVWRFLVQTQPTIIVRSGLLNNKSRIKWDQCQGHHRDEWSRWQWSEGGERLRETRAPTQLLNQLAFIHDAVKSVHFVNFTTNSCNSYYNKQVLFKDLNTQSIRLFSILDKERTRRTAGLIFHSFITYRWVPNSQSNMAQNGRINIPFIHYL